MAHDVASRILDMAGLRIMELGDPTAPSDATRTDNASIPSPSDGGGSPGSSLLAAPADHVHPASPDLVTLSDAPLQVAPAARTEIWFGVVDFDFLIGTRVQAILAGLCQGSQVELWLDGLPGDPQAGTLLIQISSDAAVLTPVSAASSGPIAKPSGPHLLTLTAIALPSTAGVAQTAGRVVTMRGLPPAP